MIDKTAERMARAIRAANPEETASVDVLKYGLAMTMNLLGVAVGCVTIGLITGRLVATLTAFAAFAALRRFSGGYHARSLSACVVISVALFSIIPLIPLNNTISWILKITTLLLVLALAPANRKQNEIQDSAIIYFRVIAIAIAAVNIFIHSPIITLALFSQALLLINISWIKEVILG